MAGTSVNSMKAAITSRVDLGQVQRQYFASRALGIPDMCPITAMNPDVDENSRPLGGSGYRLLYTNDASCSPFTYNLSKMIYHENALRPNLGPCLFGSRGDSDFEGMHRDRNPRDIYALGQRGNFVSTAPIDEGAPVYNAIPQTMAPLSLSHDAIREQMRG